MMKKNNETKIYKAIVECAIFAYFKEKYPHSAPDDEKESDDIKSISQLLLKLEKYSHIPDKERLIKETYREIKQLIEDDEFREENLQLMLQDIASELSVEDRRYILNAVILIVNEDDNISEVEKVVILQVSRYLGFSDEFQSIIKAFKASDFYEEDTKGVVLFGVVFLFGLLVAAMMFVDKQEPKINLFKTDKYQFYDLTFNRYIFYKNQYLSSNVDGLTQHYRKYAVYYLRGKASVSFASSLLHFNIKTGELTIPERAFAIDIHIPPSQELEIDRVNPQPISESEAQAIGAVVGLGAGAAVAKGGLSLTKFLPPTIQPQALAATGVVGLIGGGAAYLVTSKALEGMQLASKITETEREEVLRTGKHLIEAQIRASDDIKQLYQEQFESFIKAKYQAVGLTVTDIQYLAE